LTSTSFDHGFGRFPWSVKLAMFGVIAVSLGMWLGVYFFAPPIPGAMDHLAARLAFAVKCIAMATLFCLLSGIEAVSHERLQGDAFDPLTGKESRRLKINLRYLQNTVEQLLLFVAGLLGLAIYCSDADAMRAVAATTIVWIMSRMAFWVGYHQGSLYRVFGLVGMPQSMFVLLYVCGRFGFELAGTTGAIAPVLLFGLVEAVLVKYTRSPPSADRADDPQ
jgi:hypothetical protein